MDTQTHDTSHAHHHNGLITSAQSTLHCLTGCVIGEVAVLLIGVSLGLGAWITMGLATVLAYITGMTLGVVPVSRPAGFLAAWPVNWWLIERNLKACH